MIKRPPAARTSRRSLYISGLAATAVLFLGACASGADEGAAFDSIRDSNANVSRERMYGSWTDLLALSEKSGVDPVAAAVVGDVVAVAEGRSFLWELDAEGEEERIETEFGADKAMASTYHLTVKVNSVIGTDGDGPSPGATLTVGISTSPDVTLDEVKKDFGNLQGAVFFLQQSPVYDYEKGLYAIVESGALLATPDKDGNLHFPLLDDDDPIQPPDGVSAARLGA